MTSPSPSEPRTKSLYHAGLEPAIAATVAVAGIVVLMIAQVVCVEAGVSKVAATAISNVVVIGVVLTLVRVRGQPLAALGFVRARARWFFVAGLIAVSAWYLELLAVERLKLPGNTSALERIIADPPLAVVLIATAVAAPIAEELLFRGLIARALAQRLRLPFAVVISAAMFSAFHYSLPQALPTFVLGLGLGLIALRSGSIVPGIVLHALNNAIVIVVGRDSIPGLVRALDAVPIATLAVAGVLFVAGFALAARMPA